MDELKTQILRYLKEEKLLGERFLFFDRASGSVASAAQEKEPYEKVNSLGELELLCKKCVRCPLHTTRNKVVFGKGNENSIIMLIGEAPGRQEDIRGEPFVGRAGELLTNMLKAIELKRKDVYIANVLKCRPPGNRDPKPEEVEACGGYLKRQIELIAPKIILALGRHALKFLTGYEGSLSQIRGNLLSYKGIKVIPTYHPAALIYHEEWKRGSWEDLKLARRLYDEVKTQIDADKSRK